MQCLDMGLPNHSQQKSHTVDSIVLTCHAQGRIYVETMPSQRTFFFGSNSNNGISQNDEYISNIENKEL